MITGVGAQVNPTLETQQHSCHNSACIPICVCVYVCICICVRDKHRRQCSSECRITPTFLSQCHNVKMPQKSQCCRVLIHFCIQGRCSHQLPLKNVSSALAMRLPRPKFEPFFWGSNCLRVFYNGSSGGKHCCPSCLT